MSDLNKNIILVDPNDQVIGEIEKIQGHKFAMLHRAFSILIFRQHEGKIQLLLQQRNIHKYHGGGLWTNTCCSHPHPGEDLLESAEKRLNEEMGFSTPLMKIGLFHYVAKFDNGLAENEMDHVFIGFYDSDTIPYNPDEVQDYKWVDIQILKKDFTEFPTKYTAWVKEASEIAFSFLNSPEGIQELQKQPVRIA